MRPLYHAKRPSGFRPPHSELTSKRPVCRNSVNSRPENQQEYELLRPSDRSLGDGIGAARTKRIPKARIAAHGEITDGDLVHSIATVMLQEAFNHMNLQAIDGRLANGMSVDGHGCSQPVAIYRLWFDALEQPAPVSLDEFHCSRTASPWDGCWVKASSWIMLADRCSPNGWPISCCNRTENVIICARSTMNNTPLHRCFDDRPGNSGTPESMGGWRRRRHGRTIGYQNTSKVILQKPART